MGKPLLTDEIIERAKRGEPIVASPLQDEEETKILRTGTDDRPFGYARPQQVRLEDTVYPQMRSYQGQAEQPGFETFEQVTDQPLDETLHIQVDPIVHKSRRIENEKRGVFQAKLNKVLAVIVILFIALVIAMFYL